MMTKQRSQCRSLAALALFVAYCGITADSRGETKNAANAAVPFIHVTDFYHPPLDPDDYFDAATVFALHQRGGLSLRAVCLDVPRDDGVGNHAPAVMALGQLQVMTGASAPFAVGSPHRLTKIGDTQPNATPGDLAAVNLILTTLRESRSPVAIVINGGSRDVAIAIAREPELFRTRCLAIYDLAGVTDGKNSPKENNVVVDPLAAVTVFNTAPCPVYWLPGFDRWPGKDIDWSSGPHDGLYSFEQKWVFDVVSPRLVNYFIFTLRTGSEPPELNWWRYLNGAPDKALVAKFGTGRGMWTTAAYLHAAGLSVEEDGRIVPRAEAKSPVFAFTPITMKADDQCRISWQPAPEGKARFILAKSSVEAYRRAMPIALISLLKTLR